MPFEYKPRTPAQFEARQRQSPFRYAAPSKPAPVVVEPDDAEPEQLDDATGEGPKAKVSTTTPCVDCSHARKDHHITPEPHVADGDHAFYCVTSHCDVYSYKDGVHKPCECQHFRAQETDAPKLTRPRVGDYDRCANPACGHWKIDHCTRAKPGKAARLKPGESAYKILSKTDGLTYPCKHFSLTDPACQCTSTSCAATEDGKEFCACEKFISPLLRTRAKAPESPAKPRAPRKPGKKKTAFATGSLFPVPTAEATDVRP